jgi:hypothetical protein
MLSRSGEQSQPTQKGGLIAGPAHARGGQNQVIRTSAFDTSLASRKLPISCLKLVQGPRSARGSMTKTCPLFAFSVEGARLRCLGRSRNSPAWLQHRLVGSRHWPAFSPLRVRTKTCPLFAFSVEGARPRCLGRSRNSPAWLQHRLVRSRGELLYPLTCPWPRRERAKTR